MAAYRATGSLAPKPDGGWRYSKLDPHREFLIRRAREVRDHHAATCRRTGGPWHDGHARFDLALAHPPGLRLQKTYGPRSLAHEASAPHAPGAAPAGLSR